MTRPEFDRLTRTIWAYSSLTEPQVRALLFAQLLAERRRADA